MRIPNRKSLLMGLALSITFIVVFAFLFTPSFGGKNAFEASDGLFNSIAKGSTYYIPGLREKTEAYRGIPLDVSLRLSGETDGEEALLRHYGFDAGRSEGNVTLRADLGEILLAALNDSDIMFHNRGEEISDKYNMPAREALLAWWRILSSMERSLTNQGKFGQAAFVAEVRSRSVEVAYNFYGIEPERASSKAGILTFALLFYVLYTLWWGYAVYYLAQGLGLQLRAGAKKEV